MTKILQKEYNSIKAVYILINCIFTEGEKMKNIIKFLKKRKQNQSRDIKQIDYDYIKNNSNSVVIDVRSRKEFSEWHISGAYNIPLNIIKEKIQNFVPNKEKEIIVYCQTGTRSMKAAQILDKLGYKNVKNLDGGLNYK